MKTFSDRFVTMLLLAFALVAHACSGGDSNDDGGDNGGSDDDGVDDDIGNDDAADDDSDLPLCQEYSFEPLFTFDEENIDRIFDNQSGFHELFNHSDTTAVAECVFERPEPTRWSIICEEWEFTGSWLNSDYADVIPNGSDVHFYLDFDEYDGSYGLFIFDTVDQLLVFDTDRALRFWNTITKTVFITGEDVPHYSDPANNVCLYPEDFGRPPIDDDQTGRWLEVYGRDAGGELFGSPFYIPGPGESALSDDGELEVFNVRNFGGQIWTESGCPDSPGPCEYFSDRTYIQAVATK